MVDKDMMTNALHKFNVDETDVEDLFDDDIDTLDDDNESLEFETDENGNYVCILEHLTEFLEVGESKSRTNRRGELFHESVVETVLEMWQRCPHMCSKLLPKFPYVGIMLDTKIPEIGGFSRKHRRDEQRGTIIECINSGQIITLMTPSLLEKQYFVFLPNASTLHNMQEFDLLTEFPYHICFIAKSGDVQLTDIEISYKSIANMVVKDLYVQDVLIAAMEGYEPGQTEVEEHDVSYGDIFGDDEGEFSGDEEDDDEFLYNPEG